MLPSEWVDRIFERLLRVYGIEFMRQYEGMEPADVKSVWAGELSGFEQWPEAIKFALTNLPERPPNVIVFKNLCRKAPKREQPALPAPEVDPKVAQAAIKRIRQMVQDDVPTGNKGVEWAQTIVRRVRAGERVRMATYEMARQALRSRGLSE